MSRRHAHLVACAALALWASPAAAQSLPGTELPTAAAFLLEGLADSGAVAVPAPARWSGSLGDAIVASLFGFYRHILSPQDMAACAFEPTCSRFTQTAIHQHGFVRGVLIGADRLLRDNPGAQGRYPVDPLTGRFADPPDRY